MTTADTTAARIAEIRARAAAATPGPWVRHPATGRWFVANITGPYMQGVGDFNFGVGDQAEADEAFVHNAREDVDDLLVEVDRLTAELADAELFRAFYRRCADHIAAKRDLAEAAIASWNRGELSADAALLVVKSSLAVGGATAPEKLARAHSLWGAVFVAIERAAREESDLRLTPGTISRLTDAIESELVINEPVPGARAAMAQQAARKETEL